MALPHLTLMTAGREQEELGNETVRTVILQLLERCATDIAKAERQEAAEKLAALPLVVAALGRKLMTAQELANLLPTSDASISVMKRDVRRADTTISPSRPQYGMSQCAGAPRSTPASS
jgi:hypothetical protein